MKKIYSAFLITLLYLSPCLFAQDLTGDQIIQKVNELLTQQSCQATMTMTITTSSGQLRTFEYLSYSADNGEKNLMVYLLPKRVKGQKILMLNDADDIWAYFARTKRVRKLATHAKKQKMEGSDFSYEDMGSGDSFITDFTATKLKDEKKENHDCYTLELTKRPESNSAYAKIIMWVIKDNFIPVVTEYYDEDNPDRVAKSLVQYDITEIDGIPTGMKMIMTNKNDNTKTELALKEVKYNIPLDDNLFTERGLRK